MATPGQHSFCVQRLVQPTVSLINRTSANYNPSEASMERVEMIKKKLLSMTQDNDTTPWRKTMAQNATTTASKYPSEKVRGTACDDHTTVKFSSPGNTDLTCTLTHEKPLIFTSAKLRPTSTHARAVDYWSGLEDTNST